MNLFLALSNLFTNRFIYLLGKQIEDKRWGYTYQQYRRKYNIAPTFGFSGPNIILEGDGKIILQGSSYINRNSRITSSPTGGVSISTNCAIAGFVTISGSSRVADQDFSKTCIWQKQTLRTKDEPVQIGNDCWIGTGAFINPGLSIGNNAVVGANSVVTKNIPPHSISAGVPAKVIRFKSYLDEEVMLELAKNYWSSLSIKLKEQLKQQYKIREIPT
jgi:acetyltransferase-like isoleucine patch superfamily enzyme